MTVTIAVAGKGGVGKTSISSLLVRELVSRDQGTVLAVDADPNSNLADKLGMDVEDTIGSIRNRIVASPDDVPVSMSKQDYVSLLMRRSLSEGDGVDLLTMGVPQGQGCYCFINNVLKDTISSLIPAYPYVLVDNEAGMEHLARKTLPGADVLLLVSDPTVVGIRTAKRMLGIAKEVGMDPRRTVLVINNVREGPAPELLDEADGLDVIVLPHDPQAEGLNMRGLPLVLDEGSPLRKGVAILLDSVLR